MGLGFTINMKKIYLIIVSAISLFSCSGDNVILDNPSSETATFTFDGGESLKVKAGGNASISLEAGSYQVVVKLGDSTVADTTFDLKNGGIIHSGQSKYVIWKQLYGLQKDRTTLLNERWSNLDSVRVFGDFIIYEPEWVFLEKNWDYGLNDEFPKSKTMYITEDFKIESKVFRSGDMIAYYKTLVAEPSGLH